VVGVPWIITLEEELLAKVKPAGRIPALIDQLKGAVPPVSETVALYEMPTPADESEVVVIIGDEGGGVVFEALPPPQPASINAKNSINPGFTKNQATPSLGLIIRSHPVARFVLKAFYNPRRTSMLLPGTKKTNVPGARETPFTTGFPPARSPV
jgi:hypothetical protein